MKTLGCGLIAAVAIAGAGGCVYLEVTEDLTEQQAKTLSDAKTAFTAGGIILSIYTIVSALTES